MSEHFEATQVGTGSDVEIEGVRVYTEGIPTPRIAYRFEETGGAAVDVKVQGTIDATNWRDLTPLDESGSDHTAATIAVSASGTSYAFINEAADNNATGALAAVNGCYAQYRVVFQNNGTPTGTLKAHAYVKE